MFEEYFKEYQESPDKLYRCYLGIIKKDYPKWLGWRVINNWKEQGIHIRDIEDEYLDILVRNFYYLRWMKECGL